MKVPKARKLPSGSWFIQLRLDGESISVTAPTETECRKKAELIKAQHRNDVRDASKGRNITLSAAIDRYIHDRENVLSPSTIVGYRDIQRNRFRAYMNKPLSAINWQQAVDTEARLCSPKTVKNALGLMRSVSRDNGVEIPGVRLPAPVKAAKQWLTPEQISVFIDAVSGKKCEIPALLALHSLRKSEVCGLEWSNIDIEAKLIHVCGALLIDETGTWEKRRQNKTVASNRTVPIFIPQLYSALCAVEDKSGYVVTQHPETPYRQIQQICKGYGLPLVGWHGLRHSFASLCYSLGVNELTCMQLGGWSDYQTMRTIYTHLAENDRIKSIDKLSGFFENANKNANKN